MSSNPTMNHPGVPTLDNFTAVYQQHQEHTAYHNSNHSSSVNNKNEGDRNGLEEAHTEATNGHTTLPEAASAAPEPEPHSHNNHTKIRPTDHDVLCGRGYGTNAQMGNKRFRALCYARKREFDAGNHAAKRRIGAEIVATTVQHWGGRFLTRSSHTDGTLAPMWVELDADAAQKKAQQVMRDCQRPDRVERDGPGRNKRNRSTATPELAELLLMDDGATSGLLPVPVAAAAAPLQPILDVPDGVHAHDVLLGRGAFVNGHIGNERLRNFALERKAQFQAGSYTEKRTLACEIVQRIRALDPPGRFLRKPVPSDDTAAAVSTAAAIGHWEDVSDELAINKACQAMRDINRPDRKHREERKALRKTKKEGKLKTASERTSEQPSGSPEQDHHGLPGPAYDILQNGMVAEALENALESVPTPKIMSDSFDEQ